MCGFFAIVFDKENKEMGKILTKAGRRLSYRGYDTSGVVVLDDKGNFDLRKDVGKIDEVAHRMNFHELSGKRGIVQLRWATFGYPSPENAQPHADCDELIFGAHNGNVVNTHSLREKLIKEGHKFRGENDGELLVHVVEKYWKREGNMVAAIMKAAHDLEGDYACVLTERYGEKMYAVKKGSSLFLGVGDGFICVSSDLPAILDHTRHILPLEDGEFVEFGPDNFILRDLETGEVIWKEPQHTDMEVKEAEKEGYPHFMIKEIEESPKKAEELLHLLPSHPSYEEAVDLINATEKIYITGAGTSYHAALLGVYYFSKIAKKPLLISFASEFAELHGPVLEDQDLLLVVSQSGETKDVKNVLDYFREHSKGKVIGIVNVLGSTIALKSDLVLPIASDIEISVPATKTFINQVTVFLYLSLLSAKKRMIPSPAGFDILELVPGVVKESIGIAKEKVSEVIDAIKDIKEFYILGYGITYPAALEGSLKVKEVVYVHSEGMYSGEFKHGPLSIVEDGYPVFFITTREDRHMVLSHMNEVKTRRGKIITVAPPDPELERISDIYIPLPTSNYFLIPISATVFFQVLAYNLGVLKGIDPDHPRNISKTITVD